jgi:hypothetical protein
VYRRKQDPLGIDQPGNRVRYVAFGEQELMIIGNRNESAVEHPVKGPQRAMPLRSESRAALATGRTCAAWTSLRPLPLTILRAVKAHVS